MTSLKSIAYISRTTVDFSQPALDALLQDAQQFNTVHQVSGVLLFNPGMFFQYIEGPIASIDKAYKRIKASKRHFIMIELCNELTMQAYFEGWCMGFCRAPQGMIQALSHQRWVNQLDAISNSAEASEGLKMLLLFWQNLSSDAHPKLFS